MRAFAILELFAALVVVNRTPSRVQIIDKHPAIVPRTIPCPPYTVLCPLVDDAINLVINLIDMLRRGTALVALI